MGVLETGGTGLGSALSDILMADDIQPGSEPSYQLCKLLYLYHPIGSKMVDAPIAMAQSQARDLSVPDGTGIEDRLKRAFQDEWLAIGADRHIFNTMSLARTYGVASIAMLAQGVPEDRSIDPKNLWELRLSFNVYDPLNTAGSLVLNQDPNSMDFQKVLGISVQGRRFHRSRVCVMMNENPIYIAYTTSAFGYVGRSTYQRALFPLKSFINTMRTDDMVSRKAGVLIAKLRPAGSIINNMMQRLAGVKRSILKEAQNDNVISIEAPDEEVESLNLQNVDGAAMMARRNILKNVATAADMPAMLLENETLTEGFGEGTEDAKMVAKYIDRFRVAMAPLYSYFDAIVMHRAWNPEFYKTIQKDFPDEFGRVPYTAAFYRWKNSFAAAWPSLLKEPPSEEIKVDDVKLKAVIALVEVLAPMCDPDNKALLIQWAADNFNELKLLFPTPLYLDAEAIADYEPPAQELPGEPGEPKPFADGAGRARGRGVARYDDSVKALLESMQRSETRRVRRAAV